VSRLCDGESAVSQADLAHSEYRFNFVDNSQALLLTQKVNFFYWTGRMSLEQHKDKVVELAMEGMLSR
jgi:hypothetical protein